MKITVVSGGGRPNGNGAALVKRALSHFQGAEHEIKKYDLTAMQINACKGCFACRKKEMCVHNDDMEELRKELLISDFVIFQSPMYMGSATGSFQLMLNRLYPMFDGEPGKYKRRHDGIKSMLIMTQGAPNFLFGSAMRKTRGLLANYGFKFIGTVRAGSANELGAVNKNNKAMQAVDAICLKAISN